MYRVVFARPKEQLSTTVTWFFQGAYVALYIPLSSRPAVVQLLEVENSQNIDSMCTFANSRKSGLIYDSYAELSRKRKFRKGSVNMGAILGQKDILNCVYFALKLEEKKQFRLNLDNFLDRCFDKDILFTKIRHKMTKNRVFIKLCNRAAILF